MRKTYITILCLIALSFAISIYYYQVMPESIVSHWNAKGEADGYMPRFWGLFLIPLMLVGLFLLLMIVPRYDPLKSNIKLFEKYYYWFIIILFFFMIFIQAQTILWNVGVEVSPNLTFPIGIGILFFYIGILMEKTKRNWFIGIRTPWTLSNDIVWEKTHKVGGKLFKIAGVICLFGIFFKNYAFLFIIIPVLLFSIYSVIYSYIIYRKEVLKK